MNEDNILFQLENLQTLFVEANKLIEELKEHFENELNGSDLIG